MGVPSPATQSVVREPGPEASAPVGAARPAESQAQPRPAASDVRLYQSPGRVTGTVSTGSAALTPVPASLSQEV